VLHLPAGTAGDEPLLQHARAYRVPWADLLKKVFSALIAYGIGLDGHRHMVLRARFVAIRRIRAGLV